MNTFLKRPQNKYALALLSAIPVLACSSFALAQVPDTATTTADPGRIQQQLRDDKEFLGVSGKVEVKDLILQDVPAGAENIKFKLNGLEIDDATVYSQADLELSYADKIGSTISLADIYAIAAMLTNKYRNEGYILTQVIVPPQSIDGGNVKLRVVEGFVDNVIVEGGDEEEGSLSIIRDYASMIKVDKALNIENLERYLLLISDLPGVDARSVLSPSRTATGGADLRIIVTRDSYDASLGVNNYGSRYLGAVQFAASGALNSFFNHNEKITAQIVAAPDPGTDAPAGLELGYYALGYEQPVPMLGSGTKVNVFASYTDTAPGFDLREFDVEGISQFASVAVSHPFIRSRSSNLTGSVTFDWRNISSRSNVQDTLNDKIRAVRIGGVYEFLDTTFGVGINSIGVNLAQGLDVLGASAEGDADLTRGRGDPRFTKFTADVQRLQRVTSSVNVLVAATGQKTADALLSSEEFGVGGVGFGRGYDSSEIVGDQGIAGKIEVQWNDPYNFDALEDFQLYGFYDAGRTWNHDGTTSDQQRASLVSTGIGVRTKFVNQIKGEMFVALPVSRNVQTEDDQDARFFFNLSREF